MAFNLKQRETVWTEVAKVAREESVDVFFFTSIKSTVCSHLHGFFEPARSTQFTVSTLIQSITPNITQHCLVLTL